MMARCLAAILVLGWCGSAIAQTLDAEQASQFVVGKLFEFTCFEGSRGAGRIYNDGSVVGTIQLHGAGPVHAASLPVGTLKIKGEKVCASLRGLFFEPCFDVDKTGDQSFRGSLLGMNWAYCVFARPPSVTGSRLHQQSESLSLDPKRY